MSLYLFKIVFLKMRDDILLVKKLHGELIYLLIRFINAIPAVGLWA